MQMVLIEAKRQVRDTSTHPYTVNLEQLVYTAEGNDENGRAFKALYFVSIELPFLVFDSDYRLMEALLSDSPQYAAG